MKQISFLSFALVLIFSLGSCQAETAEANMVVSELTKKQGEFFEVNIRNLRSRPTVWFNTKSYRAFKIGDRNWLARLPVENLLTPGSYSILARGGGWEQKYAVKVLDNKKEIQHITLSDDKSGLSPTKKELRLISDGLWKISDAKNWLGKWSYPSSARRSSPFGVKRSYNNGPVESYHKGLDFAANMGAAVIAPSDMKIAEVCKSEEDCGHVHGMFIIADHGQAVTSIYMHLSKVEVSEGDFVKKGQKIGEVGHTGVSTGPHLHWGVYLHGTSVDPELFVGSSVI